MGDLRNKARKDAQRAEIEDGHRRQSEGWTVFPFDVKPSLTHRNLWLGEAARQLLKVTGTRISWRRCLVRGLTIDYRQLPRTAMVYDQGERWTRLHFSQIQDESEAKKALVTDMLLQGIENYRALPNMVFDSEMNRIKWLLTAPPSISAEDWKESLSHLDRRFEEVLRTHEAELRFHLLGQKYEGPTGPVAVTIRTRMEA
jgi:hypothetical protein